VKENLAKSMAKRAAIKSGKKMEQEEMKELIERLLACTNPNYSPEGKPTFFTFDSSKIESYFNR
jgi:DNA mismatch repair protein MutL